MDKARVRKTRGETLIRIQASDDERNKDEKTVEMGRNRFRGLRQRWDLQSLVTWGRQEKTE